MNLSVKISNIRLEDVINIKFQSSWWNKEEWVFDISLQENVGETYRCVYVDSSMTSPSFNLGLIVIVLTLKVTIFSVTLTTLFLVVTGWFWHRGIYLSEVSELTHLIIPCIGGFRRALQSNLWVRNMDCLLRERVYSLIWKILTVIWRR